MYYNGLVGNSSDLFGIFPGAFNPPTNAHLALAESALSNVDGVIFVLPRRLPHKDESQIPFETRLELLRLATAYNRRFTVVDTAGGLFIEIARELRATFSQRAELHFLCGRDAAERIVNWDYGSPDAFRAMLTEFRLLVAPRAGHYQIPREYHAHIATVPLGEEYQIMSATEVRDRIRDGLEWHHLVPQSIHDPVTSLYRSDDAFQTR